MPNEHESTFHDHLHQGDVLRDEGQLAEAESAYKAALAVDPADTNAHYKLFDLYLKMGREHEAMHELDRLPEKKWDFSQATPAFVPESEPQVQQVQPVQYDEAEYTQENSPAAQLLGAQSESVSAIQEPLRVESTDTTPDLERPPQAFSEPPPSGCLDTARGLGTRKATSSRLRTRTAKRPSQNGGNGRNGTAMGSRSVRTAHICC